MKLTWLLTALLAAMSAVTAVTILIGAPDEALQRPHPLHGAMLQATAAAEHYASARWAAWTLGALMVAFLVGCLALGASRSGRVAGRGWVFLIGGALLEGAFALLMASYEHYLRDDAPRLILGFPAPTAVMLFVMSAVPLLFLAVYIVMFDRWIMTPEDLRRFRAAVDRSRDQPREPSA